MTETTKVQIPMPVSLFDKLKERADDLGISVPIYMKVAAMEKAMQGDK